ncbi:MAG: LptE family protein [Candidatus Cloacimonetes bacterium]|nr:LPS assembly lipoprotein LptE [Candidatus Cloacimonadota bacterium]MDD2506005.1 LptE family protein [Candidatus Cloacimonadota bacterium]MDD4147949.1 LptE family protein [Candidatus Cloacimonadota bacterium]MDD4559240.1 LptE family protein [Candidatus Cloacimonadota bacterium]
MVKRFIFIVMLMASLSSCYYSVYSNAYPHLKKIRIEPFENSTVEFALADKALNELSLSVRNDGRLKLVTQDPDCLLEGKITTFEEKIYSYDSSNRVQDYQLRMVLSVTFTDLVRNEVIYENSALNISEMYKVAEGSTARNETKEEALSEIFSSIFKTVIQNSLEAW